MKKYLHVATALLTILLVTFSGFAQQVDPNKKLKSASLAGTTGLFTVWDAETLRGREANFSIGVSRYNRDPGELEILTFPLTGAFGLSDRLEVFGGINTQKRTYQYNFQTYRVSPGQPSLPSTTKLGQVLFSNEAPFMDVPTSSDLGNIDLGVKFSLLSENRGNALALALTGFSSFPTKTSYTDLNRGLSTGDFQGGFGLLLSKRASKVVQIHFNTGFNFVGSPDADGGGALADLQNEFLYKFGAAFPAYGRVQFVAELDGKMYLGDEGTGGINPVNPVDLIFGLKTYPAKWFSISGGYRATINHIEKDVANQIYPAPTNGFVFQLAAGKRRNDPPTVTCQAVNASILQEDKSAVRASAIDPDGDILTYSWSTTGGKIDGSGDTVTFDASNIAPGKYTLTVTVSDRHDHEVTCSTDITVLKRNVAPVVSIAPTSASITQGESVALKATASDANNDQLTYTWTVNGQPLAANTPTITFGTEGRKPGQYAVVVAASDGEATANATSNITVKEYIKPNQAPRVDCVTTTADVASGQTVELRANGSDPDNDNLTYTWTATSGTVRGSGSTATYNASGVTAGNYTVTVTVDDGRGSKASCSMTVRVSERVLLTREGKVPCGYFATGSRVMDNCAKAALDDLAVRMKNDPRLFARIIGYTDGSKSEGSQKTLGEKRAKVVSAYLEKKGVDASRLTVVDEGANNPVGDNKTAAGRKLNRRVEIELTAR
jgi:outer membrane protein OmpA-like peptidoglycan-associated protein